jgi:hypothetical protein
MKALLLPAEALFALWYALAVVGKLVDAAAPAI